MIEFSEEYVADALMQTSVRWVDSEPGFQLSDPLPRASCRILIEAVNQHIEVDDVGIKGVELAGGIDSLPGFAYFSQTKSRPAGVVMEGRGVRLQRNRLANVFSCLPVFLERSEVFTRSVMGKSLVRRLLEHRLHANAGIRDPSKS